MINIECINLGALAQELPKYEEQWVAISEDNRIVASGHTYSQTVEKVSRPEEVVLLKVPPRDASLAPSEG